MDKYLLETSELQSKRVKHWIRKMLKKHEDKNFISHTENITKDAKVRTTLIFEEPIMSFEVMSTIYEDENK